MSFLGELDLHKHVKGFIVADFFLMPFWYMYVYSFNKEFTLTSPVHIPIILSYCLSTASLLIMIAIIFSQDAILGRKPEIKFTEAAIVMGGLIGIFWLINQSLPFLYGLLVSFSILGLIAVLSFIVLMIKRRKDVFGAPKDNND